MIEGTVVIAYLLIKDLIGSGYILNIKEFGWEVITCNYFHFVFCFFCLLKLVLTSIGFLQFSSTPVDGKQFKPKARKVTFFISMLLYALLIFSYLVVVSLILGNISIT